MKHPTALHHILPALYQQRQWQQQWQVQSLYAQWPDIVGSETAQASMPVFIRTQTLWLYVASSIWIQEILYQQDNLLHRINAAQPGLKIRTLRCLVEPSFFKPRPQRVAAANPANRSTDTGMRHSTGFDAIVDPACREALRRLWLTLARRD
ncbi:MAG: DUF721 domain-containing protein [Desulfobulbus sp.]|jgi:predicted nucleic acid-binding Zn ribbon protein